MKIVLIVILSLLGLSALVTLIGYAITVCNSSLEYLDSEKNLRNLKRCRIGALMSCIGSVVAIAMMMIFLGLVGGLI